MRRAAVLLVSVVMAAPALAAMGARPVEEQTKIDFLLAEVKKSAATFIRNGKEYPASNAASHLARKLKFAGKRVQTSRQFIVGIASHSEETGKPYELRWPDGRRQPLAEWLLERLDFYEKSHVPAAPTAAPRP